MIGGGPAGTTAASLLARLDYSVTLLEQHAFPRPHIGESLPPNILPLLDLLEVLSEVEAAGFLRYYGADIRWAGEHQLRAFPRGEPGFQVDRGRFDELLLNNAIGSGVRVLQPAQARKPIRCSPNHWQVPFTRAGTDDVLSCRYLIDASGRRRCTGTPIQRFGPRNFAIYGYWKDVRITSTVTQVEALDEAWLWIAPLPDRTVTAAVFLADDRLRKGLVVEDLYRHLLSSANAAVELQRGTSVGSASCCAADAYICESPATIDSCSVGEAAFAIDPISSQGVQAAISSGIRGAAVANTCLRFTERAEDAIAFCRDSQRERAAEHAEWSASFYQKDQGLRSFWPSGNERDVEIAGNNVPQKFAIRDFVVEPVS